MVLFQEAEWEQEKSSKTQVDQKINQCCLSTKELVSTISNGHFKDIGVVVENIKRPLKIAGEKIMNVCFKAFTKWTGLKIFDIRYYYILS